MTEFGKPFRYLFDSNCLLTSCWWVVLEYLAGSTPRLDQVVVTLVPRENAGVVNGSKSDRWDEIEGGAGGIVESRETEKSYAECTPDDIVELATGIGFSLEEIIPNDMLPKAARSRLSSEQCCVLRFSGEGHLEKFRQAEKSVSVLHGMKFLDFTLNVKLAPFATEVASSDATSGGHLSG